MLNTFHNINAKMFPMVDKFDFVAWVEDELVLRQMSQSDLARKGGITRSAVNKLLNKQQNQPGVDLCLAIAKAFDLPPAEVFQKAGILPPDPDMDDETRRMMSLFEQMTPDDQEMMIGMAQVFLERRASKRPRQVRAEG